MVQPGSPKLGERGIRDRYSAHVTKDDLDWRCEEASDLNTRRNGSDKLAEGYSEQLRDDDNEELESSAIRAGRSLTKVHRIYLTNASLLANIESY